MLGKIYFEDGSLKYEGFVCEQVHGGGLFPCGLGTSFFENGLKHFEGIFGESDWHIEIGCEYYNNGNLKYEGKYNKGVRHYYGPRYYDIGILYHENGTIWFKGSFKVERVGSLGYPRIIIPDIFYDGMEYDEEGNPLKYYCKSENAPTNE